ncbi:MAG: hypothetical protein ACOCQD_00690 [archaeon]
MSRRTNTFLEEYNNAKLSETLISKDISCQELLEKCNNEKLFKNFDKNTRVSCFKTSLDEEGDAIIIFFSIKSKSNTSTEFIDLTKKVINFLEDNFITIPSPEYDRVPIDTVTKNNILTLLKFIRKPKEEELI